MNNPSDNSSEPTFWKKCSSCKKEIGFSQKYYLCSVSTCRHSRKGFTFCSPSCWSEHLGFTNHRESWAEDFQSPTKAEFVGAETTEKPKRRIIVDRPASETAKTGMPLSGMEGKKRNNASIQTDTLVVVSKVKKLIKEQSGFNVSQCGVDALTQKVVGECLQAIEYAKISGRKTVMGRDIKKKE